MPKVSLNLPKVNFLSNLHKFCDVLMFVISQGKGHCRIQFLVSPRVKDVWDFCFLGQGQKLAWRHPDLVFGSPISQSATSVKSN